MTESPLSNSMRIDSLRRGQESDSMQPDIVLAALADALTARGRLPRDERERLGILAQQIFTKASAAVQRKFASRVAGSRSLSDDFRAFMLRRDADIAAPIVGRSPSLSSADRLRLARDPLATHHRALAVRTDLSDEVIQALALSIDRTVPIRLAGNRRLAFSEAAERVLWERSCEAGELARVLVNRRASRMDMAVARFHRLPYSVRRDVLARLTDEEADVSMQEVGRIINTLADRHQLRKIEDLIARRDYNRLAEHYAETLQIDRNRAHDAIHDPSGELTLIAARCLGLPDAIAARQLLLGPLAAGRSSLDVRRLMDLYADLPLRVCERIVGCWRKDGAPVANASPTESSVNALRKAAREGRPSSVQKRREDKADTAKSA